MDVSRGPLFKQFGAIYISRFQCSTRIEIVKTDTNCVSVLNYLIQNKIVF